MAEGGHRRPRKISEWVAFEVDPKDKKTLGKSTETGFWVREQHLQKPQGKKKITACSKKRKAYVSREMEEKGEGVKSRERGSLYVS